MERDTENILLYFGTGITIIGTIAYLIYRNTPAGFYTRIQNTIEQTVQQTANSFFDNLQTIYNIPKALIAAIIKQESNGNANAISSAGAIGLMQIMPSTGLSTCGMTQEQLLNPTQNIICGTQYFSSLYNQYGNFEDAIAAYYAGDKAVKYKNQYGVYPSYGTPSVAEYVQQVLNNYNELSSVMV